MIIKFINFNESLGSDNLDIVLDKMMKKGFQSLSKREKELLSKFTSGEDISNFSLKEPILTVNQTPRFNREESFIRGVSGIIEPTVISVKRFQVGDEVVLIDKDMGKLPPEVFSYLIKQKSFIIREISDSLKLDVGAISARGNPFFLSPKRFELIKSKPNIISPLDPLGEDDWTG